MWFLIDNAISEQDSKAEVNVKKSSNLVSPSKKYKQTAAPSIAEKTQAIDIVTPVRKNSAGRPLLFKGLKKEVFHVLFSEHLQNQTQNCRMQ